MEDDLSIQKVQISGPTLSSLLQRFISSPGDLHGLLFGYITPSTILSDEPTATTTLTATVTSFLSIPSTTYSSFFPSRQLNHPHPLLIGWFYARRKTPLRPSLRETSISSSLSSNTHLSFYLQNNTLTLSPCLFLLLTTPCQDQVFIHTHQFKAFQFRISTASFEPKTLDIVNIGPALGGGHYGNFCTNSGFPMMGGCELRGVGDMVVEEGRSESDQEKLDLVAEGFEMKSLRRLVGPAAASYVAGLEDLYCKMLAKLDGLARIVEMSSTRVLHQENHNMKLRWKVAGFE